MSKLTFTENGSPEHIKKITESFRSKFERARVDQRFEPLVTVSTHIKSAFRNKILVIYLNKSYDQRSFGLLVYDREPTILGKALRLLVHLEDKYHLYKYLQEEGIVRVIITTAHDPMMIKDSNKWVFDTKESFELIRQLIDLQAKGSTYFEQGVHALITDSRNQS